MRKSITETAPPPRVDCPNGDKALPVWMLHQLTSGTNAWNDQSEPARRDLTVYPHVEIDDEDG